jgi:hypothetical protein
MTATKGESKEGDMAQAAHATTVGRFGDQTRLGQGGLVARLRAAAPASAERSRQRRQLDGYLATQAVGRQTGVRG